MFKSFLVLFYVFYSSIYAVDFVLFTQPKTATHLLIPVLEGLTHKKCYWAPEYTQQVPPLQETFEQASQNPNNYLFSLSQAPWTRETMDRVWKTNAKKHTFLHLHVPYSPTMEQYLIEKNCITFFVKRDPRDQIVSLLNHYKHIKCNDPEIDLISSDEEKLLRMIRKESRSHTIHFMNWLHSPICCVLDFEKLMGAHGGEASLEDAIGEMRKIAKALKMECSDSKLKQLYEKSFGHGWSFFKGKVGTWKEYFLDIHRQAMKEEIGDLLIQLGYESNMEW